MCPLAPVMIHFGMQGWLIGTGLLLLLLPLLWWRHQRLLPLIFFALFWVYLLVVVELIAFPMAISREAPGTPFLIKVNLVPFFIPNSSSAQNFWDIQVIQNILLTVPFGFGLPFLLRIRPRQIAWIAAALGIGFELIQLVINLLGRASYRTVDINDSFLNILGVLLGYAAFAGLGRLFTRARPVPGDEDLSLNAELQRIAARSLGIVHVKATTPKDESR